MRLHPEEGFAHSDKANDMQHPSQIEVLQLQTPLVEEPTQEPVHGIPGPTLVEGEEGDDLVGLGLQNNFPQLRSPPIHHLLRREQPLLGKSDQHLLIHVGRPLVRHHTSDL